MTMISSDDQVSCLVILQGKSRPFCGGTLSWMASRMTFATELSGFFWDSGCSRDRSSLTATFYLYMPQCTVHLASALWTVWALMPWLLATPEEGRLTRLLFSLCAVVFSLVWLMRSIQTRLPWLLTLPTSGFPVYTTTTACMCGMSKTQRKWARCTLLCTTLPACGTLRYVVCTHKCWIAAAAAEVICRAAEFECRHLLQRERIGSDFLLWLVWLLWGLSWS